jgi:hypothetical protein
MGKVVKWVIISLLAVSVLYAINVYMGWGVGKVDDSQVVYTLSSNEPIRDVTTKTIINGDTKELKYDQVQPPVKITTQVPSSIVNLNFYSVKVSPSPGSNFIECTITVDGKVVSREMSKNEFATLTCFGVGF